MSVTDHTQDIRIGISDRETILLSTLSKENKTIIDFEDISRVLKVSYIYARKIAERLHKKKWLLPISRGKYLVVPLSAGVNSEYTEHEFIIASYFTKNYYIAYWSALNYYGYTEQTPFTVFVATTSRIWKPNMKVHDVNYKFVTIEKSKFFGITNIFVNNHNVMISNKSKTIADALDHPEFCGGIAEVTKCIWNARKEISFMDIINYARMMKNTTIIKRLGYLSDVLKIEIPTVEYVKMQDSIKVGRSLLDPHSTIHGRSHLKWNLIVNVPLNVLLEAKKET